MTPDEVASARGTRRSDSGITSPMIGRRPTPLDRIVFRAAYSARMLERVFPTEGKGFTDDEIDKQFSFWHWLGWAWVVVPPALCIVWLVILWVAHAAHLLSYGAGVWVLVFVSVFGITGAVDALWRLILVWVARDRYRQNKAVDVGTRRMLQAAQVNDCTVLVQLVVAVIFATYVW
jgi:hypothetical protein